MNDAELLQVTGHRPYPYPKDRWTMKQSWRDLLRKIPAIYTVDKRGDILTGDIHHLPWPLQKAELSIKRNTMADSHGLTLPDTAPLLTFTKQIDVLLWPIRKE